jgi:6-pyruvoyltetrahydropterin/6-carboxytetrahydropterin synthase
MYEVIIKREFSAAHMINEIGGKCEQLHGHNFAVEATVTAPVLNSEGIMVDFRDVKKWLDEIMGELDHRCLNELPYFSGINPSSENIARFIFDRVREKLPGGISLARVTVWESQDARVSYTGSGQS